MKRRLIIFALTCLSLLIWEINGQGRSGSFPFFFVQVTDPQFGFFEGPDNFTKETSLYVKAVEAINRINPEFVVITGDLVNDRSNQLQWTEFSRITSKIRSEIPVYLTPGNHDIGSLPSDTTIGKYILLFGYDRFSFIMNRSLFIGLNSPIIKAEANDLEQKQFEWLKEELANAEGIKHIIVFSHHPLFIKDPDELETYSNIAPAIRSKYLELFDEYNVDLILSGHYHDNSYGVFNDIEMITTAALGRPLGDAPSGIRVVEVYRNFVQSTYYGLDNIPEKIELKKYKKEK